MSRITYLDARCAIEKQIADELENINQKIAALGSLIEATQAAVVVHEKRISALESQPTKQETGGKHGEAGRQYGMHSLSNGYTAWSIENKELEEKIKTISALIKNSNKPDEGVSLSYALPDIENWMLQQDEPGERRLVIKCFSDGMFSAFTLQPRRDRAVASYEATECMSRGYGKTIEEAIINSVKQGA